TTPSISVERANASRSPTGPAAAPLTRKAAFVRPVTWHARTSACSTCMTFWPADCGPAPALARGRRPSARRNAGRPHRQGLLFQMYPEPGRHLCPNHVGQHLDVARAGAAVVHHHQRLALVHAHRAEPTTFPP